MKTAIIYIPAYQRDDHEHHVACETLAAADGYYTIAIRDVTVVDHLLATGWSDLVIVALPHHQIAGWPVRVVSDVDNRHGATVVGLPRQGRGGRHRAASDSLIGRVMRHPTIEMPTRRRPSAEWLIEDYRRRHGLN